MERRYATVWDDAKKMKDDLMVKQVIQTLEENVEVDETYVTTGEKGNKRLSRQPRKRGGTKKRDRGGLKEGKIPVIAIKKRKGMAKLIAAVNGLSDELIKNLLEIFVRKGSIVNTDDFLIYNNLEEYEHRVIPRYNGKKKYAEGNVHINNAENIFSFLKIWIRIFRGISVKHLGIWINYFEFLINLKDCVIGKFMCMLETLLNI